MTKYCSKHGGGCIGVGKGVKISIGIAECIPFSWSGWSIAVGKW